MDYQSSISQDILSRFCEGIKKFNEGDFFECHDILEDIWFEIRGGSRNFYQGLIQAAVGFYHITVRNNTKGALSQLKKGTVKLNGYKPEFQGVELDHFLERINECIALIEKSNEGSHIKFPVKKIPKILFDRKKFVL
ncbi:MAG: DUF309 domain-containing protein [Ignavibacteria bacterium]